MDYTVVRGDTLARIARRQGTSVEAIILINPLVKNASQISVGQVLKIPEQSLRKAVGGGPQPTVGRSTSGPAGFQPPGRVAISSDPERMWACVPADSLSDTGAKFIYKREAAPNVSNRLHWPKGASGVTLGPGYDMKERTAAEIESDLKIVGVPASQAKALAKAAGLKNADAEKFAEDNHNLVVLSADQEFALLMKVVPPYAEAVGDNVKVPVSQNQFDALVSLCYNIGVKNFKGSTVLGKLNAGDYKGACADFLLWNKSKGEVNDGLTKRRKMEQKIFETISDL